MLVVPAAVRCLCSSVAAEFAALAWPHRDRLAAAADALLPPLLEAIGNPLLQQQLQPDPVLCYAPREAAAAAAAAAAVLQQQQRDRRRKGWPEETDEEATETQAEV